MKRIYIKTIALVLTLITMLTLIPLSGSSAAAAEPDPVEQFVIRLYREILLREPEKEGLDFWVNSLKDGSRTGAVAAYGFYFSFEMYSRWLSNREFIERLYIGLMGRKAEKEGLEYWVNRLATGSTRYDCFVGFVNSVEFTEICARYGIIRGNPPPHTNTFLVYGNNNTTKVWNLIAAGGLKGISDRPAHIAGIVGNMMTEAGPSLCPFQQEISNGVGLGIMQWTRGRRDNLERFMFSHGITREEFNAERDKHLTEICKGPHLHPQELVDRTLAVQVAFMFHELRNTDEKEYMKYIDYPSVMENAEGARAYAELFCVLALRPAPNADEVNAIIDPGVLEALTVSPYSGGRGVLGVTQHNGLAARRTRAENVYNLVVG